MEPQHRHVDVGTNLEGIVSTGDDATNIIANYNYPLPKPSSTVWPGGVGRLSPHPLAASQFVGRERELAELETAMRSGTGLIAQTVAGLGGIGKSALAHRYAELSQGEHAPIWWITAENPDQIESGLAALASRIVPELATAPPSVAAAWARIWLSSHEGWLLILDNAYIASGVEQLISELPNGAFLITSRQASGWQGVVGQPLMLGVLSPEEAVELLRRSSGRSDLVGAEAATLCRILGYLPLALRQAGAYIEQAAIAVGEYLALLAARPAETFRAAAVGTHEDRTIAATWTVTLERIAENDPLACDVFRILAWCAPDDIPRALLAPLADEARISAATGLLNAYKMIDLANGAISVHRLIQDVYRTPDDSNRHRSAKSVALAREQAVALLDQALSERRAATQLPWQQILPHIDAIAKNTPASDASQRMIQLLADTVEFMYDRELEHRTVNLCRRVLDFRQKTLGPDHDDTFAALNRLASACSRSDRLEEAIGLLRSGADRNDQLYGPSHPNTLAFRANLANALGDAGHPEQALEIYTELVDLFRQTKGPVNPDTFAARINLASMVRQVRDTGEAIAILESALADSRRALGLDHPVVLAAQHELATALLSHGNADQAVTELQSTLRARKRLLGSDHPATLRTKNELAHAYRAAGHPEAAVAILQENLESHRQVLGTDDKSTTLTSYDLALSLSEAGDHDRAVALHEAVLTNYLQSLGPNDPTTLKAKRGLATALTMAGDSDQATVLLRETVADLTRVLGPDHKTTLAARESLARAYCVSRDMDRGINLYRVLEADCRQMLGPGDQLTTHVQQCLEMSLDLVKVRSLSFDIWESKPPPVPGTTSGQLPDQRDYLEILLSTAVQEARNVFKTNGKIPEQITAYRYPESRPAVRLNNDTPNSSFMYSTNKHVAITGLFGKFGAECGLWTRQRRQESRSPGTFGETILVSVLWPSKSLRATKSMTVDPETGALSPAESTDFDLDWIEQLILRA